MTVYAYKTEFEDEQVLAIVAGDTISEMNGWWKKNESRDDVYITDILMDHVSDDELRKFKRPVVMLKLNGATPESKASAESIELVPGPNAAKSCQENMVAEENDVDEYSASTGDRRTIGEVTGTAHADKWDKAPTDAKTMKAPDGVTGQDGQGGTAGKLKKTEEQIEEERGKIVERKTNKILIAVREGRCSTHAVHTLADEMLGEEKISEIVANSIRSSIPKLNDAKKEVKRVALAEMRGYIEELNSAIINPAQEVVDADRNSIGVIRNEQDAHGNINITAIHRSSEERAEALRHITEARESARKQDEKNKVAVQTAAAKVGMDPMKPGTATSILPDGRVAQEHGTAKVVKIVDVDGQNAKHYSVTEQGEITAEEYEEKVSKADAVIQRDLTDGEEFADAVDSLKAAVDTLGEAVEDLNGAITGPVNMDDIDLVVECTEIAEPETVVESDPIENPENWVFAVAGDVDYEELVIIYREVWEKTGKTEQPNAADVDWLNINNYRYKGNGRWTYLTGSVTDGRNRLISYGCEELPALTNELDEKYDWKVGKRGQRLFKDEEKAKDYYFAICPPGFHAEEETIFGHRTWVVMFPRKRFDDGENPGEQEDSISEKTLKKYGWESHGNNVFSVETPAGQVSVGLLAQDAKENGQLLYRMGLDPNTVPYDWPFHYRDSGTRKSSNDFRQEAIRILEIARKQGIVLEDDNGVVEHSAPVGVNQEVVGDESGDDITEDVLKTLGTSLDEVNAKKNKDKDKEDDKE